MRHTQTFGLVQALRECSLSDSNSPPSLRSGSFVIAQTLIYH